MSKVYEGIFKYEMQMKAIKKRRIYKHASGKISTKDYNVVSAVDGTGRFFGVTRKAG